MITVAEYAEKIGKPYPTVAAWLRRGRIEGATQIEFGGLKVWQIPEDAKYDEPTMGRPPKTEVQFYEAVQKLLGSLGEEFGISFEKFSFAKFQAKDYASGNWTWDYDNSLQVKLRLWRDSFGSFPEEVVPGNGMIDESQTEEGFKNAIRKAIQRLLKKLASDDADDQLAASSAEEAQAAKPAKRAGKAGSKK